MIMEFRRYWLLFLCFVILVGKLQSIPIAGGQVVLTLEGSELKYPFAVSLQDLSEKNETQHFCGGSLISHSWILTAAHCLWRKDITKVVAYIGYEDFTDSKSKADCYKLKDVKFAAFQPISYKNDIALVRLQRDYVGNSEIVQFAQLPDYGMKPNRNNACSIIGYGALGHVGLTSEKLMEAQVYVITNSQCRQKLGHVWAPKKGDNTVCAVGDQQDACQGDSGGPLICNYGDTNYVYGIVSHGIACGGRGVPSIYTVTVPYVNWIRNIIKD